MGNKPVYVAMGMIVGLLAGLVIGLSVANSPGAPEPRPEGVEIAGSDAGDSPDDAPRDKPAAPDDGDNGDDAAAPGGNGSSARPAPQGEAPDLAAAIAAIEPGELPGGDGEITGHVKLKNGDALPGVRVVARGVPPRPLPDETQGDLTEAVIEQIRHNKWRRAARREAVTGADGRYTLTGIDPRLQYSLSPHKAGYRINFRHHGKYRFGDGDKVDFVAEVSIQLPVRVLMPDGTPAASARLEATASGEDGGGSMGRLLDDGEGTLDLKPGTWRISASSGVHGEYTSETESVTVEPGVAPEPLVLKLRSRPGIVGEVSVPDVYERPFLAVYLQRNPPADPPGGTADTTGLTSDHISGFDAWGFSFTDLEPGTYRVILVGQRRVLDWRDVMVGNELVVVELAMPEPKREDYIPVRVFGPDGELVGKLQFHLSMRGPDWSSSGQAESLNRPDGTYWVLKSIPDNSFASDDWWFELTVTSDDYGKLKARYDRDDTGTLELRYVEPAHLVLAVPNYNDHELRDKLRWRLRGSLDDGSSMSTGARKDDDQSSPFRLGPVAPGDYELELTVGTTGYRTRVVYSEPVTLTAGENRHTTSMPRLYVLRVRMPKVDPWNGLEVRRNGDTIIYEHEHKDVDDNVVTIRHLPAGEYELRSREGTMTVNVPAEDIVEFEARAFDCVVVSGITPGGKVEGLGLRNGDKVIKVDDSEFENQERFFMLLQASLMKENTTWTVLRNGVPTEVAFDGGKLMEILQSADEDESIGLDPGYVDD